MSFLDSLMKNTDERQDDFGGSPSNPFKVAMSFSPLRLAAMKDNKVNLVIRITNISGDSQLVSVDVMLPRGQLLGFDPTCINKAMEKKLGQLRPNESTEVMLPIWGNNQTKEGSYPIDVTVFSHYLDYNKVLHSVKKSTMLRIV